MQELWRENMDTQPENWYKTITEAKIQAKALIIRRFEKRNEFYK